MTQIAQLLGVGPTYSYEFFPPKNEAQAAALGATIGELAVTSPDFISVTYGALGSTRSTTRAIVIDQNNRQQFPAMAHLTCVGQRRSEITDLVDSYAASGVENILALRGDGEEIGDFPYAADLVEFIKTRYPNMSVGVAAHPEMHPDSLNRLEDRRHLATKLAIADFAITQFFFDKNHYRRLIDELDILDCRKPVIPGIMLFGSVNGLSRMANINNTELPKTLTDNLLAFDSPPDISKVAVDTAVQLINDLAEYEAPGLHIYTLNNSKPALELKRLLES